MIESETHNGPYREVETGRRRDPGQAAEENRQIHLAKDGFLPSLANHPENDWRDSSDKEGPNEMSIQCPWSEEPLRADYSPQNATVEMNSCNGTVETVDGFSSADARNVHKHPVQYPYLDTA